MKRLVVRNNPASPKSKKKTKALQQHLDSAGDFGQSVEDQVLNWDGILAAMTFAVPFVVGISINLQASVAIVAVLAAVLIPVSLLNYTMRERLELPAWLAAPVCALVSAGITAFAAVYIRQNFAQINDTLGMYLYLLAAYPVVGAVFYGRRVRSARYVLVCSLRNIIYFSIFAGLAGLIRELLAYNRFAGIELALGFKLEGAKMAFFGFITFAFILAGVAAAYRLMSGRLLAAGTNEDEEYSGIELDVVQETTRLTGQSNAPLPHREEGEENA